MDYFKIEKVISRLEEYERSGKRLFISSSFQSHSIPLLHMVYQSGRRIPVYFLDTGYHFEETINYRDKMVEWLDLDLRVVGSRILKEDQRDEYGFQWHVAYPDKCCFANKVEPMIAVIEEYDIWISGIRGDQAEGRKLMKEEETTPSGKLRYHPLLDWREEEIREYAKRYNIPEHPLEGLGYRSIGCRPCTRAVKEGEGNRSGRWSGTDKKECGLHVDLVRR